MAARLGQDLPDPEKLAAALDERDENLAAQAKRKKERERLRAEIRKGMLEDRGRHAGLLSVRVL